MTGFQKEKQNKTQTKPQQTKHTHTHPSPTWLIINTGCAAPLSTLWILQLTGESSLNSPGSKKSFTLVSVSQPSLQKVTALPYARNTYDNETPQNRQLFSSFPIICNSSKAGSKSQAWISPDEGTQPSVCSPFLRFLLTCISLLKNKIHAHTLYLMHLTRSEPSRPVKHVLIQPRKGKLRKDVQREFYFQIFILRHLLDFCFLT